MDKKARSLSRREALSLLGKAALAGATLDLASLAAGHSVDGDPAAIAAPNSDTELFDAVQRACFQFFWEQANPTTGLVKDRAAAQGPDDRTLSSIASTGFGLTALCIADSRRYQPTRLIKPRVIATLKFLLSQVSAVQGFFYHFIDMNTGSRLFSSEVSSIDTAILLCGALTCRTYFEDPEITRLATQLYDRVNWRWMLNGGATLVHCWTPEKSFCGYRWDTYSELMMLYLLAIGSKTNPIPASSWRAWARPVLDYQGLRYITGNAPLFTHQFSHAWIDFRNKRDAFANYFTNSVTATRAHKLFCLSLSKRFPDYASDLWGISSSDNNSNRYVAWGGPPAMGPIDGTVVPSAAAGSVPFLPSETIAVVRTVYTRFTGHCVSRYGFLNAFNPLTGWYDPDVVGIGLGITELMLENYRTQLVWNAFMKNPEINHAMRLVGFESEG